MIVLRRAHERRHDRRRQQDSWLTFYPGDAGAPLAGGFGALELLNEHRLPPGSAVPSRPRRDAEIVTYVLEGSLGYEDWMGRSRVIHAGEFQRMTTGAGARSRETNASRSDWMHVFQIGLRSFQAGIGTSQEQKRFSRAERRGRLWIIASPDARRGSLRIHQDALIYSALLDPGQHVVHELLEGRSAWLHVVQGEATLGDVVLTTGDGAGITADRAVSLTAREDTSILLLDLGEPLQELAPSPSRVIPIT